LNSASNSLYDAIMQEIISDLEQHFRIIRNAFPRRQAIHHSRAHFPRTTD